MRRAIAVVIAAAGMLVLPALEAAEPPARVEALLPPVWLDRDGASEALRPGQPLSSRDTLRTGAGGRVRLRLGEGSAVKLGQEATLRLSELAPPAREGGVFGGFLDVLRGAFRFTTSVIGRDRPRRIRARIGTMTIGIRGTDVWGKATPERDFAVLLEGEIEVERAGTTTLLDRPGSLYDAPNGAPARPVRPVDPVDLAAWAAETEMPPRAGPGLSSAGQFSVVLASFRSEASAERLRAWIAREGYPSTHRAVTLASGRWYRVAIDGLPGRAPATALIETIADRFGLVSAWIESR